MSDPRSGINRRRRPEIDLDDLEKASIKPNARIQGWHHERWPFGTFGEPEFDVHFLQGFQAVIRAIVGGKYDFHFLDLSDSNTHLARKCIFELTPPYPCNNEDHIMLQHVARINYRDSMFNPGFLTHVRELSLANIGLQDDDLASICHMISYNPALSSLDLAGNGFGSSPPHFRQLGADVGSSGLRHLKLNVNPISSTCMIAFMEALPAQGCSLHALDMSDVLTELLRSGVRDDHENANALEATRAVAAFLSDPQRCRNLAHLRFNANEIGHRGRRAIIASVAGNVVHNDALTAARPQLRDLLQRCPSSITSQLKNPNRSLIEISLYASLLDQGWNQEQQINRETWQSTRMEQLLKRITSVSTKHLAMMSKYFATRPWLRRPDEQNKELGYSTEKLQKDRRPIEKLLPEIGGSVQEWAGDVQELVEVASGVDMHHHSDLLRHAENKNVASRDLTMQAAFQVLAAARTIGCRARQALPTDPPSLVLPEHGDTKGPKNVPVLNFTGKNVTNLDHITTTLGFLKLPLEVRILILRHLDTEHALSERQFNYVVSFACEPSTINYAANLREWSTVVRAARAQKAGNFYTSAILPAQRWSWSECFASRSAPRRLAGHDSFSTCVPFALSPQQMAFLEATTTQHADATVTSSLLPIPPTPAHRNSNYGVRDIFDDEDEDSDEFYDSDDVRAHGHFPFSDDDYLEDEMEYEGGYDMDDDDMF